MVWCYKSATWLYWRGMNESVLQEFICSQTSGCSMYITEKQRPCLWVVTLFPTKRWATQYGHTFNLGTEGGLSTPPTDHTIGKTSCVPSTERLILASNGSVYLHKEMVTVAWVISEDNDHEMMVCFLLLYMTSILAYRSKLRGMFRGLKHIQHLGLTLADSFQ